MTTPTGANGQQQYQTDPGLPDDTRLLGDPVDDRFDDRLDDRVGDAYADRPVPDPQAPTAPSPGWNAADASDAATPPAGAHAAPTTTTGGESPEWSQLQAQFVDDPAAAVRAASDLVEAGVQQLRDRSRNGHDTEDLRSVFLRYRDLHRTLTH